MNTHIYRVYGVALAVLMAVLLPVSGFAQEPAIDLDNEFEVSIGITPIDIGLRSDMDDMVKDHYTGNCAEHSKTNPNGAGLSFNMGYLHNLNKIIAIGGTMGLYEADYKAKYNMPGYGVVELMESYIFSAYVMPQTRIAWYRNSWAVFYSKLAMGVKYQHSEYELMYGPNTPYIKRKDFRFAYQLSAVGVRMGRGKWAAIFELGYGMNGIVVAGFSHSW